MMAAMALLLFPKLALGLSGFETGVAVMPLVRGDATDTDEAPAGRIRNTKKLLRTAALIMSVMLLGSSFVTALLIPPEAFQPGGAADGRALAYLAHERFGPAFGTLYDVSTIAILWFAGASALAGLLNLVPRYLPQYGMAPEWARANRPLVIIITGINIVVTLVFRADVEAQGGAYATGVLVLMSSAALAVAISAWRRVARWVPFFAIAGVFFYTTVTNMVERPEGIKIASLFILGIVISSLVSRTLRSTELRVHGFVLDETRDEVHRRRRPERIDPDHRQPARRRIGRASTRTRCARRGTRITCTLDDSVLFLEVRPGDASQFTDVLKVEGVQVGPVSRAALPEPGDPERDRRAAAAHPRQHRAPAARLLRLDRGQPDHLRAEVPRVRRRRYGAGHARGAPQVGTRSAPPSARARRVGAGGWSLEAGPSSVLLQPEPRPPAPA